MGHKTYDSIGAPLQGRDNIVLSRNNTIKHPFVTTARSLSGAIHKASPGRNIAIIGGAGVFEEAIHMVDVLRITKVRATFDGCDTYFPLSWIELYSQFNAGFCDSVKTDKHNLSFITYYRKK